MLHDEIDDFAVSNSWITNSVSGSLLHKASGMRVSPANGIECDGREYKLCATDVELDDDGMLGAGASATVWRGRIRTTGTPVAVKSLRVEKSEDRALLLNEVRALMESEGCPYLVQWYAGFSTLDGQVHLVLELMDAGNLADLRNSVNGPLPPRVVACVALQVLRGIDHLHSRRLLHNDIKPGNLLLNSRGEVKVTDFGIAKSMKKTLENTCIGTQIYLAPEKCDSSGYSLPADIWSFGVVLFEFAAGEHPFSNASSFPEIYAKLFREPEPRLSEEDGHPPALCDLVALCLTRDASQRATAGELLVHDFVTTDVAPPTELCDWLAPPHRRMCL